MKMSIWYILIGFLQLEGERFELKGKVFNDPLTPYHSRVRNEKKIYAFMVYLLSAFFFVSSPIVLIT